MTRILVSRAAHHHWLRDGWMFALAMIAVLRASTVNALPIFDAASISLAGKITGKISPVARIPILPIIEGRLAQQVAGIGGYLYWNKTLYAELTAYSTADGIWSFLSKGNQEGNMAHPQIYLRGYNPYYSASANFHPNTQGWMPEIFCLQFSVLGLQELYFGHCAKSAREVRT